MAIAISVIFAISAWQLGRIAGRAINDKKLPRSFMTPSLVDGRWVWLRHGVQGNDDAGDDGGEREVYVHEVLACLIDNVYSCDKGKTPEIPFKILGYKIRDDANLNAGRDTPRYMVFERIDNLEPNGGLVRLRREDDKESGETMYEDVGLPKFVVAVRGTIISKKHLKRDILDDLKIVLELACNQTKMYEPLMRTLSKLHRSAPGPDGVWVTGHSLGAAVVHVATLRLVEDEDRVLTTHLFNPPDVSMDILFKKFAIGMANGLGSGAGKLPGVGPFLERAIRGTASATIKVGERTFRNMGMALAEPLFKKAAERKQKLLEIGYRPHRYVNLHDPVCNEIIGLFQRNDPPVSISVLFIHKILSKFLPVNSEYLVDFCHLIPRGFLHTNEWATGSWHAHKLRQWYLHEPVKLTSKLAG